MNILIAGYGYVGKQMHNMLHRLPNPKNIEVYDPKNININDISLSEYTKSLTKKKFDYCFICVPTPMLSSGKCDISQVEETIKNFEAELFIIKSTIAVGTVDHLENIYHKNIIFSPEYCGESSYDNTYDFHTEAIKTPFIVLGGKEDLTAKAYNLLLPIVGPEKKWFFLAAKEAEMVKYMENTFFATKIAYCNEMYEICKALNIRFSLVREAWLADPRINPMHTAVFKNRRGFSGKCLPKDLNALIFTSSHAGYKPKLLEQVYYSNEEYKQKNEC